MLNYLKQSAKFVDFSVSQNLKIASEALFAWRRRPEFDICFGPRCYVCFVLVQDAGYSLVCGEDIVFIIDNYVITVNRNLCLRSSVPITKVNRRLSRLFCCYKIGAIYLYIDLSFFLIYT